MTFVLVQLALFLAFAEPTTGQAVGRTADTVVAAKPGAAFRDCPDCPEMVSLPSGDFVMGAPQDEPGVGAGETPQRRVSVGGFAMGKYDVTRDQWAAFVTATGRPTTGGCAWASKTGHRPDPNVSWRNVEFPQAGDHPVVCITFEDAEAYARWLSRVTGRRYRLPTEAEWEYAARAGSTTPHYWGAEASHERANYGQETCCAGLATGRDRWVQTSPVGAFPPNAFGLHDMHGNVMQWVQDCLHNYSDAPRDGSAYVTPGPLKPGPMVRQQLVGTDACAYRMLRGGDWGNPPRMIRAASRNYAPAPGSTLEVYKSGGLGLRVVRSLD